MFNLDTVLEWGKYLGYPIVVMISLIGIRFLFYFHSYFFHWSRYRRLETVTTSDLRALPFIPFIKIQITTRGALGSTEVIRRGIANIIALVKEAPDLYRPRLSVEVVSESHEQKYTLERDFGHAPIPVQVFVLPDLGRYETPNGTKLKARALHYMVELRRRGVNRRPGKTFIVHYDEESVMEPDELRKLIRYLATTDKQLTEGPIYYPLEYGDASALCRVMEANRPIGCFECREVMESGKPLHLHGSNLVIDEELENELGWDIGSLDGQPFVAEDYVFGVLAFLKRGPQIFGWHGCVMLEQPPFSLKSAFKQRYRWIIGILQGMTMMGRMSQFRDLPRGMRLRLVWGTRYRILTFAFGLPTGAISLLYLLYQTGLVIVGKGFVPLPLPIMCWLLVVGFLWLNSIFIGSWYNISNVRYMSLSRRWAEVGRVLTLAPLAGILESAAGFWAVVRWVLGRREVSWQPTPKTKQAETILHVKPGAASRKITWKLGVASFVSLLVIGASFQGLMISGHDPFAQTASLETISTNVSDDSRDQTIDMVVRMRRPYFQTGMVFPQWGSTAYSNGDVNWLTGLKDIQQQTAAQWIELPINFYQSSIYSTQVMTTKMTPTPAAVAAGIRIAHAKNYYVFVVPLLTVEGTLTWSGSIKFNSLQQTQAWFESYWQAYKPYVVAAAQAGAAQVAIGTEFELLQEAPASLWNWLIGQAHQVFPSKLTYDINWSSLYYPLPSWLRNRYLSSIGVSVYNPLADTPQRLAPNTLPALWGKSILPMLDGLAVKVAKPVLISEIGYRDTAFALYRPWERDASVQAEPVDLAEQAAAYEAALKNVIVDTHITGIYFWAWSVPLFGPNWKPAARVLYKWYTSPLA